RELDALDGRMGREQLLPGAVEHELAVGARVLLLEDQPGRDQGSGGFLVLGLGPTIELADRRVAAVDEREDLEVEGRGVAVEAVAALDGVDERGGRQARVELRAACRDR